MKRLNFYPYYKELLTQRAKTTTLRLNPVDLLPDERVVLTVGWTEDDSAEQLHPAKIEAVYKKRIGDLTESDLAGESPDCLTSASAQYVMSCIYREILSQDTIVWVVKFSHV